MGPLLTRRRVRVATVAAASALAVAALWHHMRRPGPPVLAKPSPAAVVAAEKIPLIEPIGDQPYLPLQLKWRGVEGAARYKVTILEVDEDEVWSAVTRTTFVWLPADVRSRFSPYKTLLWRVTALTPEGRPLAESDVARFRLGPE